MIKQAASEFVVGFVLLSIGIGLELISPTWWPVMWVHAVALQCAGVACLLDAVIRPHDPPSRVLIAGLVIGYGLMLSP